MPNRFRRSPRRVAAASDGAVRDNSRYTPERARSAAHYSVHAFILIERTEVSLCWPAEGAPVPLSLAELHWLAASVRAESPDPTMPAADPDKLAGIRRVLLRGDEPGSPPPEPGGIVASSGTPIGRQSLVTPVAIALSAGGYDYVDHYGVARITLTSSELWAALSFATPAAIPEAVADQRVRLGLHALSANDFERLAARLSAAGLLARIEEGPEPAAPTRSVVVLHEIAPVAKSAPVARGRHARTKVIPVIGEGGPLLPLGLMLATARAHDGGRLEEDYEFVADWNDQTVPNLTGDEAPALCLFSNYVWTHAWNVGRSVEVKSKSPQSVTIHGGPNTPLHAADKQAFFDANPHVDVAVHGEGEATFVELLDALRGRLGDHPPDLSPLAAVPGLSFRSGGRIVHTGPRDRIADLATVASPYLAGLFDSLSESRPQRLTGVAGDRTARRFDVAKDAAEIGMMTIETNRGCPYGCTFCDWGSATLSRIRTFDLQRVFAELEWCAAHKVKLLFCADANFGIFERDVEIVRKLVELTRQYGYPQVWESSYAKNTVKHLREIIETLRKGRIVSMGVLSLQSVDTQTLHAVNRSNIRVEKYDELAAEFARHGLPLVVELMMGLPGSSMKSFLNDLQQCIDREVKARVNPTELLMNSPMNEPAYREKHRIETFRPLHQDWSEVSVPRTRALVVSTSTFTREDYDAMERYRRVFLLCENYGVLRQVSRFVHQETGLSEIEFYAGLADEVRRDIDRWPVIAFTFDTVVERMIPPVSWVLFIEELRAYLITCLRMADDPALSTALRVQHALIPARNREFPQTIALEHDFAAWHRAMLDVKRQGTTADWPGKTPRLNSFGPADFRVDDPQDVCTLGVGMPMLGDADSDWELASLVARPMRFRQTITA